MNKDQQSFEGFTSLAIHGGHKKDPNYAHLTPIYASSTYVYDTAEQGMRRFSGEEEGFIYSRWGNPTMAEAEEKNLCDGSVSIERCRREPIETERHFACIRYGGNNEPFVSYFKSR